MLDTNRRSYADNPSFCAPLREATGVWLSGGDQSRLIALYGGTAVERELAAVLRRGGVIGGTSAGASAVTKVMMAAGGKAAKGFGLLDHIVIDQHFNTRPWRMTRLTNLLHTHPDQFGIGIDERTAIVIRGGDVSIMGIGRAIVAQPDAPPKSEHVYHAGEHFKLPTLLSVASR
jgi:cyanophycinase